MNDSIPTVETVCARLEALLPKVANPLRDLVERRIVAPAGPDARRDRSCTLVPFQVALKLDVEPATKQSGQ